MAKKYRVGVIGFAHMHINTLMDEFKKMPGVEWVACADTVPETPSLSMKKDTRGANLKRAREVIGIPRVYDDYREMLKRDTYDIVIFCPENAKHGEVAEAIAAARREPGHGEADGRVPRGGPARFPRRHLAGSEDDDQLAHHVAAGHTGHEDADRPGNGGGHLGSEVAQWPFHGTAVLRHGPEPRERRREGGGVVAPVGDGRRRAPGLLLLRLLPLAVVPRRAGRGSHRHEGEPHQPLWQRGRQRGDHRALPPRPRHPRGHVDHLAFGPAHRAHRLRFPGHARGCPPQGPVHRQGRGRRGGLDHARARRGAGPGRPW